jgi:hypothetical protein
MATFIISVLAFLLTIFPSCGMLLAPYQSMTFPGEKAITEEIMAAIAERDIAAIEDLIGPGIKRKYENIPRNIGALVDAIEGEIVDFSWNPTGGVDKSNFGTRLSTSGWDIRFKTTTETYVLTIGWVIVDNRKPERVGLGNMALFDSESNLLGSMFDLDA